MPNPNHDDHGRFASGPGGGAAHEALPEGGDAASAMQLRPVDPQYQASMAVAQTAAHKATYSSRQADRAFKSEAFNAHGSAAFDHQQAATAYHHAANLAPDKATSDRLHKIADQHTAKAEYHIESQDE